MSTPLPFELTLDTRWLGNPLWFLAETDSTNRVLLERAAGGAPAGAAVLTDHQQEGRGRRGRGWSAPPGTSLLWSVLLRPERLTERHGLLPLVVAVAVARAIEGALALDPQVKWPNDLLLAGRKVCGTLIESRYLDGGAPIIVIGTGLNVNQSAAELAALPDATSLRQVTGTPVPRGPLMAALLAEMERALDAFESGWNPHDSWRARALLLGEPVRVQPAADEGWAGIARDIAPDGALLVEDARGTIHRLHAADVSVRHVP